MSKFEIKKLEGKRKLFVKKHLLKEEINSMDRFAELASKNGTDSMVYSSVLEMKCRELQGKVKELDEELEVEELEVKQ